MARQRRIFIALLSAPFIVIAGVWASGPVLEVNRPYGHGSLVVEGWMPEASLREALQVFERGRYDKLILTGAMRPVSHYLRAGESVKAVIEAPARTELMIRVAGLPGVSWSLYEDQELVIKGVATSEPMDFHMVLMRAGSHTWRLAPDRSASVPDEAFALFLADWQMNGRSLHMVADSLWITNDEGGSRPAARDHATQAALLLTAMGMDATRIVTLPVKEGDDGRTAAAAQGFARYAIAQHVDTCDVVTVGVHARRSWRAFRGACGANTAVGIIALEDPVCGTTWTSGLIQCWLKRAKELAGLFASSVD